MSYGVAFLLIVGIGAWMASGSLIQGGQGAGNGERAVLDAIDLPEENRIKSLMEEFGLIQKEDPEAEVRRTGADKMRGGVPLNPIWNIRWSRD